MTAKIISLEGGRSKFDIEPVRLTENEIAHSAGADDPVTSAQERAEARFDEVNGSVQTEAQTRLTHLRARQSAENTVRDQVQTERERTTGALYAKTPSKHDPKYRMSAGERSQKSLYTVLRFVTLGVTTLVIALYARGSGFSPDISSSWAIALLYAFPAFLLSGVISNKIDYTDDLKQKRRTAKNLGYVAISFLLVWVGATAIMFAPEEASSAGFQVNFSSPAQVVQSAQDIVDWLFPKSIVGIVLLFTHVLTDIFAAAALATHAKLQGLKGRETEFVEPKETSKHRELWDFHTGRLGETEREIEFLEGVCRKFTDARASSVADARNRIQSLMLEMEARTLQAKVEVIYGTAGIAPVAKGA